MTARRWLELQVDVAADIADVVASRLMDLGAPGTIEESAPGGGVRLRAHFEDGTDRSALRTTLADYLEELGIVAAIGLSDVVDEDWADGWRRGFPPLPVGGRLLVRPPWGNPTGDGRLEILIEPAMAFGTGHHESTHGALLLTEQMFDENPTIASVLDVGTGSGVLAIAAARLGAVRVLGIDNDPLAIAAANRSVAQNQLDWAIELRVGVVDDVNGEFDLLLANLYAGLLQQLFPGFARRVVPGGFAVVAGLLDLDAAAVQAAADDAGFDVLEERHLRGWSAIAFRKR